MWNDKLTLLNCVVINSLRQDKSAVYQLLEANASDMDRLRYTYCNFDDLCSLYDSVNDCDFYIDEQQRLHGRCMTLNDDATELIGTCIDYVLSKQNFLSLLQKLVRDDARIVLKDFEEIVDGMELRALYDYVYLTGAKVSESTFRVYIPYLNKDREWRNLTICTKADRKREVILPIILVAVPSEVSYANEYNMTLAGQVKTENGSLFLYVLNTEGMLLSAGYDDSNIFMPSSLINTLGGKVSVTTYSSKVLRAYKKSIMSKFEEKGEPIKYSSGKREVKERQIGARIGIAEGNPSKELANNLIAVARSVAREFIQEHNSYSNKMDLSGVLCADTIAPFERLELLSKLNELQLSEAEQHAVMDLIECLIAGGLDEGLALAMVITNKLYEIEREGLLCGLFLMFFRILVYDKQLQQGVNNSSIFLGGMFGYDCIVSYEG